MILWVLFAVLAAAVVLAVTRPLYTQVKVQDAPDSDGEIAVYRDQLAEIDAERARGMLGGSEAEGARIELARRLIRRSEEKQRQTEAMPAFNGRGRKLALYAAAALPVFGIAIYLAIGSPQLPSRPYAARLDAPLDQATPADLIARVEAHLRQHPEDGRGWDVLAPVYMRTGDFSQAADAFQRAMRLEGESPKRLAGFARALIMLQNGVVTEPARKAYQKLLTLEKQSIEADTWLAIAQEQDGDLKGAAAEYQRLLPGAEEPWKGLLTARLQAVTDKLSNVGQAAGQAGGADAPAATMDPAERDKFIARMVDGLAERLKQNGDDLDGWIRLVRSYVVLGRREDATTALAKARGQFASDEKSLAQLNDLAQSLGLGS
ncbi:MAG: c-type cytochrome biogenesis protein CcmI [Hyphomicrobium sp.]|jgi:cytochrome c-type biogenesis protein CcmH